MDSANLKQFNGGQIKTILYAPSWAKSQAKKYVNILKLSATYKGVELQNFINEWNLKNPNNKTSYSSLIKMRRRYYEYGVKGLLSRFGNNNGRTTVNDEDFDYFKSLYLKEGAPSLYSCWEITLGHAILEYGVNKFDFPSHMAFRRRMMKEIPQQAIFIARNGVTAWNRKQSNYIERDYSNIICGKVWVSDHAQIDVALNFHIGVGINIVLNILNLLKLILKIFGHL